MIQYLYKITNNLNGKFYIGVHKTTNPNDEYFGSGKYLKRAINKYGIENFSKEILEYFNNTKEMFAREKEIVTEEFVNQTDTYNLKIGGSGGFDYVNKIIGPEAKRLAGLKSVEVQLVRGTRKQGFTEKELKIAQKAWRYKYDNDAEFKKRLIDQLRSMRKSANSSKARIKRKATLKEINHQQGCKNSQWGTQWITNGIESCKIQKGKPIPEGYSPGRVLSKNNT